MRQIRRLLFSGLVICLLLTSIGCIRYVKVHDEFPIIPEVERPTFSVPELTAGENPKAEKFAEALFKTVEYAKKLEALVKKYNEKAKEHNENFETILGDGDDG